MRTCVRASGRKSHSRALLIGGRARSLTFKGGFWQNKALFFQNSPLKVSERGGAHANVRTCDSLTRSLACALTRTLTRTPARAPAHSPAHPHAHPRTHTHTRALTRALTCAPARSPVHFLVVQYAAHFCRYPPRNVLNRDNIYIYTCVLLQNSSVGEALEVLAKRTTSMNGQN